MFPLSKKQQVKNNWPQLAADEIDEIDEPQSGPEVPMDARSHLGLVHLLLWC